MSDLIAITYPTEQRAREVLSALQRMQQAHLLDLDDACHVTKDERGRIELHQSINTTARGALGGAFWGSLIGLIFLNPLLGLVAGTASGAVMGKLTDVGVSDQFMRELAADLQVGKSTLFVLVRRVTMDRFIEELARYGGHIIHTSLSRELEERLRQALAPSVGNPPIAAAANPASPAAAAT
jgi:uncharacterized membrane protein